MCIDHIEIKPATDPEMGRGAFARRALPRGTLVAPAPMQVFPERAAFAGQTPEALFVNYCFQSPHSDILLFPYGPGVNLINHNHYHPNVGLRWSTSPQHHGQWLDLPLRDFWKVMYPGAIILEVVALRDIQPGEELFLDYGAEWDAAWKKHVQEWKPFKAEEYVYPADMDLTKAFRTLQEQESNPYPPNLATACFENNWHRDEGRAEWEEVEYWPEGLTYCHILKRDLQGDGSYVYEVALVLVANNTRWMIIGTFRTMCRRKPSCLWINPTKVICTCPMRFVIRLVCRMSCFRSSGDSTKHPSIILRINRRVFSTILLLGRFMASRKLVMLHE